MSLKQTYFEKIRPELTHKMGVKNILAVPRIKKVVINVGAGESVTNKKAIENVVGDLRTIAGQKPVVTKARAAVSAFKIRKGLPIGVKVTLRRDRMYYFLEKLFKIVFPRIRDFHGISKANFDGRGNLNIGLTDQTLFPEIDYDKIDKVRGLEVTIVTTAQTDEEAVTLFEALGLPIEKKDDER
ncbi:MAG: 50S ribosomal protein L5 [Candidatus Paceibacterota bacterium]